MGGLLPNRVAQSTTDEAQSKQAACDHGFDRDCHASGVVVQAYIRPIKLDMNPTHARFGDVRPAPRGCETKAA